MAKVTVCPKCNNKMNNIYVRVVKDNKEQWMVIGKICLNCGLYFFYDNIFSFNVS